MVIEASGGGAFTGGEDDDADIGERPIRTPRKPINYGDRLWQKDTHTHSEGQVTGFVKYSNEKVEIEYPSGWRVYEIAGTAVKFRPQQEVAGGGAFTGEDENNYQSGMDEEVPVYFSVDYFPRRTSLDEHLEYEMRHWSIRSEDIIESKSTTIKGKKAKILVARIRKYNATRKSLYIEDNNMTYMLIYNAPKEKYNTSVANHMIDSFEIK